MEECHTEQDWGMLPPRPPLRSLFPEKGNHREKKMISGKGWLKFSHQRTPWVRTTIVMWISRLHIHEYLIPLEYPVIFIPCRDNFNWGIKHWSQTGYQDKVFHNIKLVPEVFMMVQCYQGSYWCQVEDVNNNEKNSEKREKFKSQKMDSFYKVKYNKRVITTDANVKVFRHYWPQ